MIGKNWTTKKNEEEQNREREIADTHTHNAQFSQDSQKATKHEKKLPIHHHTKIERH